MTPASPVKFGRAGQSIVCGLLALTLLLVLLPTASALTTSGRTDALVNLGQVTKDASSAIPVVGFNMTSDTGTETLQTISVEFIDVNGFDPGNDKDLRRLDPDSGKSGVGLYRDDGLVDDVLDAGDTPLVMDTVGWGGNRVDLDLSITGDPVPTTVSGLYHWIIVIRTADVVDTLDDFDTFRVLIVANSIVATSGLGFVSQPTVDVLSAPLTVRLTRGVDMTGGATWLGPGQVAVNSTAVLGLRVVDGGGATNYGIDDRIVSLQVRLIEDSGILTSADFQPIQASGSVSGLALYRDDGLVDDEWDSTDTPIVLAGITPVDFIFGGVDFTLTPVAPGLAVPDHPGGALDFFFVVRTRNIVTGDDFRLQVESRWVTVDGVLASQPGSVDDGLRTPLDTFLTTLPSGPVQGDSTPPRMRSESWVEDSAFLFARGLTLYFGGFMTTPQAAFAAGEARDDESGLGRASFSSEPSLATSPPDQPLAGTGTWEAYDGSYLISASSGDTGSPAVVTIFDAVGNGVSSLDTGNAYIYTRVTAPVIILPNPGWMVPPNTPTWVDSGGKLWFGPLIPGPLTVTLRADLVALSGAGLKNATASAEPSLAGGPRPGSVVFGPVPHETTWTNEYDLNSSNTDSASPVTLWAEDNLGNNGTATFPYGKDDVPPTVSVLTPQSFATVTGEVVVRVSVTNEATAVKRVQMAVDVSGTLQQMLFDGTAYFAIVSTGLYADGAHRFLVLAEDMVGNVRVQGLDVSFVNALDSEPPMALFVTPADGSTVSGVAMIQVFAADASGVESVRLEIAGRTVTMVQNRATGYYEYAFDSGLIPDGGNIVTVTVTDGSGKTSTASLTFNVANAVPIGEAILLVLQQNALLLLILVLAVLFVLGFRVMGRERA